MIKFFKFFEYAYLIISVLFIYEAYEGWGLEGSRSVLYLCFAGAAIFMFFFKRSFRKRIHANNKPN